MKRDPIADDRRRREIVCYFAEHGATATTKAFGINRTRVYTIVNKLLRPGTRRQKRNLLPKQ